MIGFTWNITIKKQLTSGPTATATATPMPFNAQVWDPLEHDLSQLTMIAASYGTTYTAGDGSLTMANTGTSGGSATRMWWELAVEYDLAALVGSVQWRWTLVTKDTGGNVLSTTSGSVDDVNLNTPGVGMKLLLFKPTVASTGSPAVNAQTITFDFDTPFEVDTLAPPTITEGAAYVGSSVYVTGANTPGGSNYLYINASQDLPVRGLAHGPRFLSRQVALGDGLNIYRQPLGGGPWELVDSYTEPCNLGAIGVHGPYVAMRPQVNNTSARYSTDYGETWQDAADAAALLAATDAAWPYPFSSATSRDHIAGHDGISLGIGYQHYISGYTDLLYAFRYKFITPLPSLGPMRQAGETNCLPQPVLYRTADGTWHVGWFAGGQWREYRSDDLLGSAWTAETPQDLGNLANLANCALGIGRDGRQVAVGYLVGWSGGPDSQLVIWTRSGYGGTWTKAPTIFQPASCVTPYIFEGDDGWWELGWLLGGTFSRYRAIDPGGVDAWAEVS